MARPIVRSTKGFLELGENMRALTREVNLKIARKATGKGAQLVKRAVIKNAPVAPEAHMLDGLLIPAGTVKKNIIVKKIKSPLTSEHIVTVRGGRKNNYARRIGSLQEFGTVKQTPKSFMRKGFDETKANAVEVIRTSLDTEITKAVQALPKK